MSKNAASKLLPFCIFIVLWLVLMIAGRSAMFRDPGTFWHVVAGEKIISSGHVPGEDSFSFTFSGRPWVADQWLAEIAMAAVHGLAGWDGLLTVTAAILAGIYAFITMRLLRAGMHWLLACAILALALLAGSPQFHVRPLIFTLAGLAITFSLLVDVDAGRKSPHCCWLLVPLFIIWANLHGGVLAGLASAALCAPGWCLLWVSGRASPIHSARDAFEMIALVFVLGLGLLINPYGPDLILLWLKTWTMPLPELIQEHGRLNFASSPGWAVLGLGAIYIIVLVGVLPQRPKITWLLPMVFFVLAVQRVRNAPLFAITTALALPDILSHSRLTQWLRHRQWFSSPVVATSFSPGVRAGRIFDNFIKIIAPLAVVAFVLIIQATGISLPVFGRGWARFDSARWPLELLPELETIDHRDLPADRRIFNDLAFGGFLIYHAPNLKIFIDDRCALYGSEFLGQYDLARRAYPRQIDRWQRQYRFCYALVETGGPFDRHLQQSAQWTLIGRSPAATLYQFRLGISKNIH